MQPAAIPVPITVSTSQRFLIGDMFLLFKKFPSIRRSGPRTPVRLRGGATALLYGCVAARLNCGGMMAFIAGRDKRYAFGRDERRLEARAGTRSTPALSSRSIEGAASRSAQGKKIGRRGVLKLGKGLKCAPDTGVDQVEVPITLY